MLEEEFEVGSRDPKSLHVVKLNNKNGSFEITLFPVQDRGQKRENSKQPKKKIRRVAANVSAGGEVEKKKSLLSSKAKPFVPKSMKRARPEESDASKSVSEVDDVLSKKKRKIEEEEVEVMKLQPVADQQSFYAVNQSAEKLQTSTSPPTRSLSSTSVGSEHEKMLLRAARFAKSTIEVEEKEQDAMEEEDAELLEELLNDEESEI